MQKLLNLIVVKTGTGKTLEYYTSMAPKHKQLN